MFEPYGSGSFGHQFAASPAHKRARVPASISVVQAAPHRNQTRFFTGRLSYAQCLGQRANRVAARIDCSQIISQSMPP